MTIKLNISAKKLDNKVNYISFQDNVETKTFIQNNGKEVERKKNKIQKAMTSTSVLTIGLLPQLTQAQIAVEQPEYLEIEKMMNPQMVFEISLNAGLMGLGISFGVFVIFMMGAGLRMSMGGQNKEKSKRWITDIIKGFCICLVAIPTAFALYSLAITTFSQLKFSGESFLNTL